MAQGLEVLQAAIEGKKIRKIDTRSVEHDWVKWCSACRTLEADAYGHSRPYILTIHELWHSVWEIEDQTMSFGQVIATMQQGQDVERSIEKGDTVQYRIRGGSFEMRYRGQDEGWSLWEESMIGLDCVEATDWRVVNKSRQNERPTTEEFRRRLIEVLGKNYLNDSDDPDASELLLYFVTWRPQMFRQTNA